MKSGGRLRRGSSSCWFSYLESVRCRDTLIGDRRHPGPGSWDIFGIANLG